MQTQIVSHKFTTALQIGFGRIQGRKGGIQGRKGGIQIQGGFKGKGSICRSSLVDLPLTRRPLCDALFGNETQHKTQHNATQLAEQHTTQHKTQLIAPFNTTDRTEKKHRAPCILDPGWVESGKEEKSQNAELIQTSLMIIVMFITMMIMMMIMMIMMIMMTTVIEGCCGCQVAETGRKGNAAPLSSRSTLSSGLLRSTLSSPLSSAF